MDCRVLCPYRGLYGPGSSVHGTLQAWILEWVAILFSKGSSQPRDRTWVSCIAGRFFTIWAIREVSNCDKWKWSESLSVVSDSLWHHGLQPIEFHPWNSLGKNTPVGSHSHLQGIFLTRDWNWIFSTGGSFFTIWANTNCQQPIDHRTSKEFQKTLYFCYIDYIRAFNCVDHNELWKIPKETGISCGKFLKRWEYQPTLSAF